MTTYPLPLPALRVTIAGTDRTNDVLSGTLAIHQILGSQVDTADFSVKSPESWRGPATAKPIVGQPVTVEVKTGSGSFMLQYAGTLSRVQEVRIATKVVRWDCSAVDYTALLSRILVNRTYINQTVSDIVIDLVNRYAPLVSAAGVQSAPTIIASISFAYVYPLDAIQQLATAVGYDFYVDANKVLHFYLSGATSQPSPLSITDTSNNFMDLTIEPVLDQVRNRVWVQGGAALSNLIIEQQDASGTDRPFTLAHQGITAVLSSGTTYPTPFMTIDGVEQIVCLRGVNDLSQFPGGWNLDAANGIVDRNGPDTPLPPDASRVEFAYQWNVPIGVMREDQNSIATVAALEGTDYPTVIAGDAPLHWFRLNDTNRTAANSGSAGVMYSGGYIGPFVHGVAGALVNSTDPGVMLAGNSRIFTYSGTRIPQTASTGFSLEAWVQTAPGATYDTNSDRGIVSEWLSTAGGALLYVSSGGTYAFASSPNAGTGGLFVALDSAVPPTGANYDHVAATYLAGAGRIYVNGVLANTSLMNGGKLLTSGLEIGNFNYDVDGTQHRMSGNIDEVAVYAYALSGSQIAEHFYSGRWGGVRDAAINDNSISSFDQARKAGDLALARWADVITHLSWTSYVSGWQLGDTVSVNVTTSGTGRSFIGQALIQELDLAWLGAQRVQYTVRSVSARFNIVDFLKTLNAVPNLIPPAGVVLNLIEQVSAQAIAIDGHVTLSGASAPFVIEPDWGAPIFNAGRVDYSLLSRTLV